MSETLTNLVESIQETFDHEKVGAFWDEDSETFKLVIGGRTLWTDRNGIVTGASNEPTP